MSDDGVYRRIMLAENGACTLVAGWSHIGQLRDGIGARCHYTRAGDIISITSMGEIDGTGPMEALPQAMRLQIESGHLSALDGGGEILMRVPK